MNGEIEVYNALAVIAAVVVGIFLIRKLYNHIESGIKKKRDTSTYNRGQNYLFRIQMVLKNGREYDLQIYSNHLYQSVAELVRRTRVLDLSEDGFIQRGRRIEFFYGGKEVWVESNGIFSISMEIMDNPLNEISCTCVKNCIKKEKGFPGPDILKSEKLVQGIGEEVKKSVTDTIIRFWNR